MKSHPRALRALVWLGVPLALLALPGAAPPELPQAPPLPQRCLSSVDAPLRVAAARVDHALRAERAGWDVERERELGQQLATRAARRHPLVEEGPLAEQLDATLDRLTRSAILRMPAYRAHLVDRPQLQAFSLPGGDLYLYRGLLEQRVANADQLAFALAHELAHVELGHALAAHQLPEHSAAWREELPADWLLLSRHAFSPLQELEADAEAARLVEAAGYDPAEALRFWEQDWPPPRADLEDWLRPEWLDALDAPQREQLAALLASHPPLEARRCVIQDAAGR